MGKAVREPIQVYLAPSERGVLDACAAEMGVSRSEVLRRALAALGGAASASVEPEHGGMDAFLTPPRARAGPPPPSLPVAPLAELLQELDEDRSER